MFRKLCGAVLALVLLVNLLCAGASAADISVRQARQADLDMLYTTMKTAHPNLFAHTPERDFLARKAEIGQRLDGESDFAFALDCETLAALAGDSHTSVSVDGDTEAFHICLFDVDWYDGSWVLSAADSAHKELLGAEVTAINGFSMEQILERFEPLISWDNPVRLRYAYWKMCYVRELYDYLQLAQPDQPLSVTVKTDGGDVRTLSVAAVKPAAMQSADLVTLKSLRTAVPATEADNSRYYSARALDAHTYYIQYNRCAEDPALSMDTFCAQIRTALDAGEYSLILLDLRHNGGGSDGVIAPLLELLVGQRDRGVQVAGLIGKSTFSSAIINAVELQEMGFPLAGEETSGSVDHFGAVQTFQMPNSGLRFSVSSKFIALSGLLDAAAGKGVETLEPDVRIPQTLADYRAGKDSCVEAILSDPSILKTAQRGDAPVTRGRFAAQLYQAAGSPRTLSDSPFADLFGIEWYLPAVSWIGAMGISAGTSEGVFSASRTLSWQEAAVLLTRSAAALGIQPRTSVTAPLPAALQSGCWNRDALEKAWSWGLLPRDADFSAAPTRTQGAAMAAALFAL